MFIEILKQLSQYELSELKYHKQIFPNSDELNIWVNTFSTGYYYYYLEDSHKIPILNYLLYLDQKELL